MVTLEHLADLADGVLDLQETILRKEYDNPEAVKRSPLFTQIQAAKYIGISRHTLINFLKEHPDAPRTFISKAKNSPARFTTQDIAELRKMMKRVPARPLKDRPYIISVGNLKGGAGKTTMAIHLAQYLALKGYRVLAIDADPQGSLSNLLGFFPYEAEELPPEAYVVKDRNSLNNLFIDMNPLVPAKTYWSNLDLIPNNVEGYSAEYALSALPVRFDTTFHDVLYKALHTSPENWRSKAAFGSYYSAIDPSDIEEEPESIEGAYRPEDYDIVIVDTPPSYSYATQNALYASDALIVSVPSYHLDLLATGHYFNQMSQLFTSIGHYYEGAGDKTFDFVAIMPQRVTNADRGSLENYARMMSVFGEHVLSPVPPLKAISSAATHNRTVYEILNDSSVVSKTTVREGLELLEGVFDEVLEQIERATSDEQ